MRGMKTNLVLFFVCLAARTIFAETPEYDSLENGYLYERPNKTLSIPTNEPTEVPHGGPVTDREDIAGPGSTETFVGEQNPEEITGKPEPKTPDGYLPPEDQQFLVRENLELESSNGSTFKGRKRNAHLVKGKIAAAKENEKNRLRQILGLSPKQTTFNRPGNVKAFPKQIFRN